LWVADNRPDGNLRGMTSEDVEIAANWTGDSGVFAKTLAEVRFVDGSEGAYCIHDWTEHNAWGRQAWTDCGSQKGCERSLAES
jgi:hypothetical protein